jgi:hypothetical protein
MKYLLSLLAVGQLALAQDSLIDAEMDVLWDPNSESSLAGYIVEVKENKENGRSFRWDVGIPPQKNCLGRQVVYYTLPERLPLGSWTSYVFAYGTDGQTSDPSDPLNISVRLVSSDFSYDQINWIAQRYYVITDSDKDQLCGPGNAPKVYLSNTPKYFRHSFIDDGVPTTTTGEPSQTGAGYLNWNVPHIESQIIEYKVYKIENSQKTYITSVFPPNIFYQVNEAGSYVVTSINAENLESENSNIIEAFIPILQKPLNLRISKQ